MHKVFIEECLCGQTQMLPQTVFYMMQWQTEGLLAHAVPAKLPVEAISSPRHHEHLQVQGPDGGLVPFGPALHFHAL